MERQCACRVAAATAGVGGAKRRGEGGVKRREGGWGADQRPERGELHYFVRMTVRICPRVFEGRQCWRGNNLGRK